MTYQFENSVIEVLKKSGWSFYFFKNISSEMENLRVEGYNPSPATISFLEKFSGLRVKHATYSGDGQDESCFSVQMALDTIFLERVKNDYEIRCKEELCPIGVGFSEHLVYLISPTGKIFAGYDDYFCKIGDSVEASFSNIFFDHKFEEIV